MNAKMSFEEFWNTGYINRAIQERPDILSGLPCGRHKLYGTSAGDMTDYVGNKLKIMQELNDFDALCCVPDRLYGIARACYINYCCSETKLLDQFQRFQFDGPQGSPTTKNIICSVSFENSKDNKTYFYKTYDETLAVGDQVLIPVKSKSYWSKKRHYEYGWIEEIDHVADQQCPMPIDQISEIQGRVDHKVDSRLKNLQIIYEKPLANEIIIFSDFKNWGKKDRGLYISSQRNIKGCFRVMPEPNQHIYMDCRGDLWYEGEHKFGTNYHRIRIISCSPKEVACLKSYSEDSSTTPEVLESMIQRYTEPVGNYILKELKIDGPEAVM